MKTNEEILNELVQSAKEVTGKEFTCAINMDTKLVDDLALDSIELLYLVMDIEKKFGVTFDNEEIDAFLTLGAIVDFIKANAK